MPFNIHVYIYYYMVQYYYFITHKCSIVRILFGYYLDITCNSIGNIYTSRQNDVTAYSVYNTNYFVLYSQGYQFFCGGTRCFTQRSFVIESPMILPIPLDYFSRIGVIRDGTQLPQYVMVQGERYKCIYILIYMATSDCYNRVYILKHCKLIPLPFV